MSISIRFNSGELWAFRGQRLRFERHLGNDRLYFVDEARLGPFQVEDEDGELCAPSVGWALEAFAAGDLKRKDDLSGPSARTRAIFQDIGPSEAAEMDSMALLRAFVVRGLDAVPTPPRSDKSYRIALAKLWAAHPEEAAKFPQKPCPRAVRNWMDERGTPGDRPLSQMVSMSGRVQRAPRLHPLVRAEVSRAAIWYWSALRWSITDAYARLTQTLEQINLERAAVPALPPLVVPKYETLRKEVRRTECFETVREKRGLKFANSQFKACGKGLRATRILQLGAMDHTTLDGVVVISFEPPSIYSVMECIKRANRPKMHLPRSADQFPDLRCIFGRFDEIVVDNGKEFSGVAMQDALTDAGISLRLAPVGSPTFKAIVERLFGTINSYQNTKLPGGVLKPELLREFGYDPAKDAVLTLTELEEILWETLTLYHITPRRGQGSPPAQLWAAQAVGGINTIGDDASLDRMLGKVDMRIHPTWSFTSAVNTCWI
jgi:putative transposase